MLNVLFAGASSYLFLWIKSVKEVVVAYIPAILATIAVICGVASNLYCETLQFPQVSGRATLLVGVFSFRTTDAEEIDNETWVDTACQNYGWLDKDLGFDYELDAKARTAMAFAIIAGFVGGIATFFSFVLPCSGNNAYESRSKKLSTVFFVTSVLQGLSLFIHSSSLCNNNPVLQYLESSNSLLRETFGDECEWAAGFRLNITSVVFWILAGLAMKYMGPPNYSAHAESQVQTVTYQQNEDGTISEANVTIVKGAAVHAAIEQPMYEEGKY